MADLVRFPEATLREKVLAALSAAGADDGSAQAAAHAMLHASRLGIDSHGVRLTAHYCAMMRSGRINPQPQFALTKTAAGSAMLDADNGIGHAAAYAAMGFACELAGEAGIGAVGVFRSSHFGAAGAYALAGAEAGFVAFSTTNADSLVGLHGGTRAFHGTNPLAIAAPVAGEKPWLMDLATSSIPFNRVHLARTLGSTLPEGVATDASGAATRDPHAATALIPLGGAGYGYKGAALAGVATLFSAILTGGAIDPEMIPMFRKDAMGAPRNVGHFCLAIDPDRFVGRELYDAAIKRYRDALRAVPPREGERVMAPGDREWDTEAARLRDGIPIDRETAAFLGLG
jgi:LDH2 family malate/lactate/ureidoglycolate dehydrogenase